MLTITVQGDEFWDEDDEKFVYNESTVLEFEHSLVSLSKWEQKYHKLFLTGKAHTEEEMFGYMQAMLVTPNVPDNIWQRLTNEHIQAIDVYINDPMTGTTISELPKNQSSSERISSELIYFWMSQYGIAVSCETWHLNRLFTLIKIHYAKSQKPKQMSRQKRVQSMAELNAQRKAQLGTRG